MVAFITLVVRCSNRYWLTGIHHRPLTLSDPLSDDHRKAVKAAVVLLPLLGVSNIINMVDAPLGRSVTEFAVWSYLTHFLTSFQGFFVSLLYCFLNGEVSRQVRESGSRDEFLRRVKLNEPESRGESVRQSESVS